MVPVEVKANPCQGKQNAVVFSLFLSLPFTHTAQSPYIHARGCTYMSVYLSVRTCAPVCGFLQPVVQITYFCLTTASSRGGAHMQKATWKGLLVAVSFYYALRCHVC